MRGSDDMLQWLSLLGHSVEDLDSLNTIHVAGTKGKGSTCAFAASFLKAHRSETGSPKKIGLYTSPHMRHVRERIRINGEPISEEYFATRFFEIWDKLPAQATPILDIPRYLQLLALLSFHVFIEENVDVAIYEAHMGGEFDATNIIKRPTVSVVTSIAMDHVELLGPTIANIAWHKAGIFKPGSLAFSAPQEETVAIVLQQRAFEKKIVLEFVDADSAFPTELRAIKPRVQMTNCSLALAAVRAWQVSAEVPSLTDGSITRTIEQFVWPGRFQQINEGKYHWFLDAAHNEYSVQHAVKWFSDMTTDHRGNSFSLRRVLIFAHFSKRDGEAILDKIAESLQEHKIQVGHVILTSYDERKDGQTRIDRNMNNRFSKEVLDRYAKTWEKSDPAAAIYQERTIEEALFRAREIGDASNGIQALITGSLHLVSGALNLLESEQGRILPAHY
ncbi:hypothetical protein B7463_g4085, partial [Scytalidium lignicola]